MWKTPYLKAEKHGVRDTMYNGKGMVRVTQYPKAEECGVRATISEGCQWGVVKKSPYLKALEW